MERQNSNVDDDNDYKKDDSEDDESSLFFQDETKSKFALPLTAALRNKTP